MHPRARLILLDKLLSPGDRRAVFADLDATELSTVDVAIIALADKVALDASSVTQADTDEPRSLGLTDADILDVVLTAAACCFFSKVLDGLGIQPDASHAQLDPDLRDALTVGRPIAEH